MAVEEENGVAEKKFKISSDLHLLLYNSQLAVLVCLNASGWKGEEKGFSRK